MGALALGILALVGGLLLMRSFATASVASIRRGAGLVAGAIGVLLVALLLLTGRGTQALGGLIFFAPVIWRAWQGWKTRRRFAAAESEETSVTTATLVMHLNHETGTMSGEILRGPHAGRPLAALGLPDLLALLADCRRVDPDSVALLEAWTDRAFPDWHEQVPPAEGAMDRAEALAVLGLGAGATPDEIRAAYRRLMATAHPDRGGSDWLAARINQARDILDQG